MSRCAWDPLSDKLWSMAWSGEREEIQWKSHYLYLVIQARPLHHYSFRSSRRLVESSLCRILLYCVSDWEHDHQASEPVTIMCYIRLVIKISKPLFVLIVNYFRSILIYLPITFTSITDFCVYIAHCFPLKLFQSIFWWDISVTVKNHSIVLHNYYYYNFCLKMFFSEFFFKNEVFIQSYKNWKFYSMM